jgi:hypothetical protein
MIAMQYGFTFPTDYDMNIIRQRISTRGAALDGFPGLVFKSYLFTDSKNNTFKTSFNRYAPFYLWDDPRGMSEFLSGPGFAGLVADFGRPQVRVWCVSCAHQTGPIRDAHWATMRQTPISENDPVADQDRQSTEQNTSASASSGALATVAAFDPAAWTSLEFRLWATPPKLPDCETQCWEVGYLAQ